MISHNAPPDLAQLAQEFLEETQLRPWGKGWRKFVRIDAFRGYSVDLKRAEVLERIGNFLLFRGEVPSKAKCSKIEFVARCLTVVKGGVE